MERALEHLLLKEHFKRDRMAFVVGPRQVGKTTLARQLLRKRRSMDLYRNWDDLTWRRALARDPYGFVDAFRPKTGARKALVVLDEIHKFPRGSATSKGFGIPERTGSTSWSRGAGAWTSTRKAATVSSDGITSIAFIPSP
jgi:hypothetical protein